jgi:hypothetical protein
MDSTYLRNESAIIVIELALLDGCIYPEHVAIVSTGVLYSSLVIGSDSQPEVCNIPAFPSGPYHVPSTHSTRRLMAGMAFIEF